MASAGWIVPSVVISARAVMKRIVRFIMHQPNNRRK